MPTHDVFWPATRNDIHWGIWTGTALIALITLGRAAAGAVSPIHPAWALLIAAIVLGGNLLTWWWSLPRPTAESARAQVARGGIALLPSLILGVVLSGSSAAGLIGILVMAACGLAFVVVQAQQQTVAPERALNDTIESAIRLTPDDATDSDPPSAFDDPQVQQQIIRRRTEAGECLEALLRIEFASDQREASIHLPIQPAFSGVPEVECEPLDDSGLDLKVAAVHPYGVRIDAKRPGGELGAATIAVGVVIHSATAAEAAA